MKKRLFLLSIHEDPDLDLKSLRKRIGATGQLGFARPEHVITCPGGPGALTRQGLINDTKGAVTAVIDASLMKVEQVNFHPLINTKNIGLRPEDLLAFVRSCNREPMLINFESDE